MVDEIVLCRLSAEGRMKWHGSLQGRVTYSLVPCIRDGRLIVCIFLNFETVSFDLLD